jgi:hypothetical protein
LAATNSPEEDEMVDATQVETVIVDILTVSNARETTPQQVTASISDNDPPTSQVNPLPAVTPPGNFSVSWSGSIAARPPLGARHRPGAAARDHRRRLIPTGALLEKTVSRETSRQRAGTAVAFTQECFT